MRAAAPSGLAAPHVDVNHELLLLDVTSMSVLLANHNGEFVRLLERNCMMPNKYTREIMLANDNTQHVDINLYYGESSVKSENFLIQTMKLDGLDGVKQGTKIGELTIETDVNGVTTVELVNLITGHIITVQLPEVGKFITDVEEYLKRVDSNGSTLPSEAVRGSPVQL